MSRLRNVLERYIRMRQGLGYKYDSPGRRLAEFGSFMGARGAETITRGAGYGVDYADRNAANLGYSPDRRAFLCPACCPFRSFDRSAADGPRASCPAGKALSIVTPRSRLCWPRPWHYRQ